MLNKYIFAMVLIIDFVHLKQRRNETKNYKYQNRNSSTADDVCHHPKGDRPNCIV